jgi:hypothetical protein
MCRSGRNEQSRWKSELSRSLNLLTHSDSQSSRHSKRVSYRVMGRKCMYIFQAMSIYSGKQAAALSREIILPYFVILWHSHFKSPWTNVTGDIYANTDFNIFSNFDRALVDFEHTKWWCARGLNSCTLCSKIGLCSHDSPPKSGARRPE